jgi:hypothetical protein
MITLTKKQTELVIKGLYLAAQYESGVADAYAGNRGDQNPKERKKALKSGLALLKLMESVCKKLKKEK